MKYCIFCGHPLPETDEFCTQCGESQKAKLGTTTEPEIDVTVQFIGKNCPYCQFTIKPNEETIVCADCGMAHHKECWQANNNKCTTFGCSGVARVAVPQRSRTIPEINWGAIKVHKRFIRIALAVVAVLLVVTWFWLCPVKYIGISNDYKSKNVSSLENRFDNYAKSTLFKEAALTTAGALLMLNDHQSTKWVGERIIDKSYQIDIRVKLIDTFAQYGMIVPQFFDYLSDDSLENDLRTALVASTNKVDSTAFDRNIQKAIEAAKSKLPADAIVILTKLETLDVNKKNTEAIRNPLFVDYARQLLQFDYHSQSPYKEVFGKMENTFCQNNTKYSQQVVALKNNIAKMDNALTELDAAQKQVDSAEQDRTQLDKEITDLQQSLAGVDSIYAYNIGSNGNGTYEISFNLWGGDRALLKTYSTQFNSTGWFSMYVKYKGTKRIKLENGGSTNWAYYEEDTEAVGNMRKLQADFLRLGQAAGKIDSAVNNERIADSKFAALQSENKKYLMIIAQ
ncbi:MAG: RING finger protein [Bacillota bacterium]